MLEEESERNKEMLQIWQERTYHQELQRKTINEEIKDLRENGQWRGGHKTGFWRRSQVGTVLEISSVKFHNKYIIPNQWSSIKRELNV